MALAWLLGLGTATVPLYISLVYLHQSSDRVSSRYRMATSVHGVVIAVLQISAVTIGLAGFHNDAYGMPFFAMCVLAAGLLVYSFWKFQGNKLVHLLGVLNVFWLLGLLFLGGMMVTGRWL